jgi:hypothetical protein
VAAQAFRIHQIRATAAVTLSRARFYVLPNGYQTIQSAGRQQKGPAMRFRVLTRHADLIVTTDPIPDVDGKPSFGMTDWDNGRILMARCTPPHLRTNVLCHEIYHCWRFEIEQPESIEAQCDLFGLAASAVMEDMEAQGGTPALHRLFAGDTVMVDDVPPLPPTPAWEETIRAVKFRHLRDDHDWEWVKAECRRQGIDLSDAWVKYQVDPDTGEEVPRLLTTYNNLVAIAGRTGKFVVVRAAEFLKPDGTWVGVWNDAEPPEAARASVVRSDVPEPIVGTAYLKRSMRWMELPGLRSRGLTSSGGKAVS